MLLSRVSRINTLLLRSGRRQCPARPYSGSLSSVLQVLPDAYLWVHQYTGLPWWAVISMGALAIRMPVFVLMPTVAQRQARRTRAMYSLQTEEANIKSSLAIRKSVENWTTEQATQEAKRLLKERKKEVFDRHNCHLWKLYIHYPVLFPLWALNSWALRDLIVNCEIDMQCAMLGHQGPFFCTDLISPDVTLCVLMCLSTLWTVELPQVLKRKFVADAGLPGVRKPAMQRLEPLVLAGLRVSAVSLVMAYPLFPAGLMLSLLAGNTTMAAIHTSLQVPAVRRLCRIDPTPLESQNLAKDIVEHFKAMMKRLMEIQREEANEIKEKRQLRMENGHWLVRPWHRVRNRDGKKP